MTAAGWKKSCESYSTFLRNTNLMELREMKIVLLGQTDG
jgi:hypothetical protein